MKRPTIFGGIAFAFVVAVFAVPVWWGVKAALPFSLAFRLITLSGYLAYCFYLLRTAKTHVGALTLATASLVIGLALSFLPLTNSMMVGALALMISLNRSLLFQRSLIAIALDGLVSGSGLIFAGYLFTKTGSVPVALWGFFLLQSVFVLIPPRSWGEAGLFSADEKRATVDVFVHPQRQAEAALERIVQEGAAR
ncbi:MAG: hypothetical protein O6826_09935 [Acidobacteria bacterium]|nr:hypothetical protein [Acidobacteriota bacterium]